MKERLYNQNPWWREPILIESDFKIVELEQQKYKYHHPLIEEFDYQNPGIYTLRGPRQIGKSTVIKLIIQKLIKSKVNPRNILFYSCEDISGYRELIELIEDFSQISSETGTDKSLNYIFLDEVSFIDDWQKGIKSVYERGLLKKSFLLLSGSNAYDLHHQAERLPGRRGKDPFPDKVFLPLTFREFFELTNPRSKIPKLNFNELVNNIESHYKTLSEIDLDSKKLKQSWNIYKLTGGFLTTINDYFTNSRISEVFYQTYLQWIKGDINKLKRSEKIARQILYEACLQLVNRIDWQSIAKKVDDLQHYSSVVEYMEILESFFINKVIYQIDLNKKTPNIRKQKKIYFIDNFIFWTVLNWNEKHTDTFLFSEQKSLEIEPKLIESFVAQTLMHSYQKDYFDQNLFFWNANKEIDFIISDDKNNLIPIEVKYQNTINSQDFLIMKKMNFKKGLIVSKNNLELFDKDFLSIPYYLFGILDF